MKKIAQLALILVVGVLASLCLACWEPVIAGSLDSGVLSKNRHHLQPDPGRAGVQLPAGGDLMSTLTFTSFVPQVLREVLPCTPGAVLTDTLNDVPFAHVDVALVNTQATTRVLQAVFQLRDLPEQLTYDRVGVPHNAMEYGWAVDVDRDRNIGTGCPFERCLGADYEVNTAHFVSTPDNPTTQPLAHGLQANVWFYGSQGYWEYSGPASFTLDTATDVLTMTGEFPFDILPTMRLFFFALDHNPGGEPVEDTSSCRPSRTGSRLSGTANTANGPEYHHR